MMNFDEIFWMIGERNNVNKWWEIFDSELFDEVVRAIATECGIWSLDYNELFNRVMNEVEGFEEWYNEMAEDL